MTWTKLGDEFPDECERVEMSDAAFRTHVEGLCWVNRLGLDGRIPVRHVRRFAFTADPNAAIAELINVGFWRRDGDALVVVHHAAEQIEAGVLQARRDADALRKQRERLRRALRAVGIDPGDEKNVDVLRSQLVSRDSHVTEDVTRTRDPGRVGSGLENHKNTHLQEADEAGADVPGDRPAGQHDEPADECAVCSQPLLLHRPGRTVCARCESASAGRSA